MLFATAIVSVVVSWNGEFVAREVSVLVAWRMKRNDVDISWENPQRMTQS